MISDPVSDAQKARTNSFCLEMFSTLASMKNVEFIRKVRMKEPALDLILHVLHALFFVQVVFSYRKHKNVLVLIEHVLHPQFSWQNVTLCLCLPACHGDGFQSFLAVLVTVGTGQHLAALRSIQSGENCEGEKL